MQSAWRQHVFAWLGKAPGTQPEAWQVGTTPLQERLTAGLSVGKGRHGTPMPPYHGNNIMSFTTWPSSWRNSGSLSGKLEINLRVLL